MGSCRLGLILTIGSKADDFTILINGDTIAHYG